LDEFGEFTYEDILVPLLDDEGNPLIFTEGPMLTEFIETPLVQYYEEMRVDDEGNPIESTKPNTIVKIVLPKKAHSNGIIRIKK